MKKGKEKDLLGKVIKVKKEHKQGLESLIEKVEVANTAFSRASVMVNNTSISLFDYVNELYPELEGYRYSINHSNLEVVIIGKKEV